MATKVSHTISAQSFRELGSELDPLKVEEIEKYYKEDKFIWTLFLAFRRFDRWLKTTIFRKRYEFI
ncbi:MAG TPA: hypothetical protein QGG35_05660, partial [Candidatus Marinimicrobia bacterium]|nr:hypothetical protein [Candidatus Neomarinimicrobiota bacterium]